jgi:hypothetical protein
MARGMIRLPQEVIEINKRKAQDEKENKKILIPMEQLTIRGQSGKSILRGHK